MTASIRAASGPTDRDALEHILRESFGSDELPWGTWMDRIGHENLRVVEEDGVVRGGLGFYRFGQHWGGARVSKIGLAGVGIAPGARGRGLARKLLVATLEEARSEGVALAGLYASSATVYRSVGFEQAATALRYAVPIASLPPGELGLDCNAFDPSEAGALRQLYCDRARRWDGHLDRNEAIWSRIAKPHNATARGYRFGAEDDPEGYCVYQHIPGQGLHFDVSLRDFAFGTRAAAARCMALLSGLRSLAGELRWLGCARDPILSLLPEQTARVTEWARWMLRIVDVEGALRARGFARDGEARFDVRDALFGDLGVHLRVRDGRAEVTREPTGRASVSVDVRGLAALYAGFAHPTTLVAMGLLDGDLDEAIRLAGLFGASEPWVCDWY